MKKTYIIPELEVVKVQTQQMLAASALGIGDNFTAGEDVLAPEMDLDNFFDGGDNLDKFFE
jgi:hypothetical protein